MTFGCRGHHGVELAPVAVRGLGTWRVCWMLTGRNSFRWAGLHGNEAWWTYPQEPLNTTLDGWVNFDHNRISNRSGGTPWETSVTIFTETESYDLQLSDLNDRDNRMMTWWWKSDGANNLCEWYGIVSVREGPESNGRNWLRHRTRHWCDKRSLFVHYKYVQTTWCETCCPNIYARHCK